MRKVLAFVGALVLAGCASSPLTGNEASQDASLSGGAEVAANDVQELTNTNTQVSSQTSTQEAVTGSGVDAQEVGSVQTEVITNNGIVLTIPVIAAGLLVTLILGWFIPAPPILRKLGLIGRN